MAVKIKRFDVAFLKDGEVVEVEVEVYGVDRLRAEMEGRRSGLKGQTARVRHGRSDDVDIDDMGDMLNRQALEVWAACVRLKLYDAPAAQWRTSDYVGSEEIKDAEADADPTQSGPSTGDA